MIANDCRPRWTTFAFVVAILSCCCWKIGTPWLLLPPPPRQLAIPTKQFRPLVSSGVVVVRYMVAARDNTRNILRSDSSVVVFVDNNKNHDDSSIETRREQQQPRKQQRRRRANSQVRAILDLLVARYGNDTTSVTLDDDRVDRPSTISTRQEQQRRINSTQTSTTSARRDLDWTKMRRFLYRSTTASSVSSMHNSNKLENCLHIKQVSKVLALLNETFPHDSTIQASILMQSPRILKRNVDTQLRPTIEFLQSLYKPSMLFHEAISRNSDLLLTSGTGYPSDGVFDLVETYLIHEVRLSYSQVRRLKKTAPSLFQVSMARILSVVEYLQTILMRGEDDAETMESSSSSSSSSSHAVQQQQQQKAMTTIGQWIVRYPSIFQLSVSDNLMPRIQYIQQRLQLSDTELAMFLKSSRGGIFCLSTAQNIQPTIDLLSTLLVTSSSNNVDDLRKSIIFHPQILALSLPNLQAKIQYFHDIDALERPFSVDRIDHLKQHESLASRIFRRSPTVYSLSLRDNIIPTVEYLARIWGTNVPINPFQPTTDDVQQVCRHNRMTTSAHLGALLRECPSILTLSLEGNIQPTVNFYVRAGYLNLDSDGYFNASDAKSVFIRGREISTSLFNRLLPRWNYYCNQRQLQPSDNNADDSNNSVSRMRRNTTTKTATTNYSATFVAPRLHTLVQATDVGFCRQYNFDLDQYIAFKDEAIPRLKFSSQFDTWIHTGRPIETG